MSATNEAAKPLKAYVLRDRTGYVEHQEVTYAATARDARKGGYLDNVAYIDLAAKRAPEFDVWAQQRVEVPVSALIAAGWHWECGGCYRYVDRHADARVVDDAGRNAYCNARCCAKAGGP